jgi:hypothetical protein
VREKAPPERADLVDDVYAPFVRPLRNLIVLFAQAEAEWLCLASELSGCTEKEAQRFLDIKPDVKQEITSLAQRCGIEGFDLQELSTSTTREFCCADGRGPLLRLGEVTC